jgi:carboxyl-terminal processing protease
MDQPSPTQNRVRSYFKIYIGIIAFIGIFALGVFAGRHDYVEPKDSHAASESKQRTTGSDQSFNKPEEVDLTQYWNVWNVIKHDAYNNDVKDSDLLYGSMEGLVNTLGDPYSVFFPPTAANQFASNLSGELEGIGAEVGIKDNQLVVIAPVPNSPAERAGLHPGDKILAIDQQNSAGLDVTSAVQKIRGTAGTKVTLTIIGGNDTTLKPHDVTIAREKIIVPSLTYSLKNGNIAYIKVSQFNGDTTDLLNEAIKKMPKDLKGVILDLRGDPGGRLDAAVEVSSKWIDKGQLVVEERGRLPEFQKKYFSEGTQPFKGIKTVVLVNKGSASASEIVAGALQDDKLATLLGEQTFGKGSVQNLYNLPDGSALKLTIAEWYTPLGKNINLEGIEPDVEFKQDWSKEKIGEDTMLNKALGMFK